MVALCDLPLSSVQETALSFLPGRMESHSFIYKPHHASELSLLYGLNFLFSWRLLGDHWRMPTSQNYFGVKRSRRSFHLYHTSFQPLGSSKAAPHMPPQQVPLFPTCACDCVTRNDPAISWGWQVFIYTASLLQYYQGIRGVIILCDFNIIIITNISKPWSA